MSQISKLALVLGLALAASPFAHADVAPSAYSLSLNSPGLAATAGGGQAAGGTGLAGTPVSNELVAGRSGWSAQTKAAGTATAAYSYNQTYTVPIDNPPFDPSYWGSSSASSSFGHIGVSATNAHGPVLFSFPLAVSSAGWTDTLTITAPGYSGAGTLSFKVAVNGTLTAADNGRATYSVGAWKDGAYQSPGAKSWEVSTYIADPNPLTASQTVHETLSFDIPFTFGTSFKLGVFAQAFASNRSAGYTTAIASSNVDFSNGLTWLGVSGATAGGKAASGYTIASAAGIDWVPAASAVPEPGSAGLLLGGAVFLGAVRRQRRVA